MKRTRITVKNYRGFPDNEPVRLEIGPGFTALVGRNNSGKSALKLLLYELRPMFQMLANFGGSAGLIDAFVQSWVFQVNYPGVADSHEIFNNTNDRPVSIEIEVLEPEAYTSSVALARHRALAKVVATCERAAPNTWRFASFAASDPKENLAQAGGRPSVVPAPSVISMNAGNIDCRDFIEAAQALASARYYGPFRNAINQGAGDHFDLKVGTSFIELWKTWKTGGIRAQMRAIDRVTEDIRRLFEFERLEINASAGGDTLILSMNGQQFRLNELGSGLAQFIMVLGNAATTPPSFLLIDEPETNLHPALQIDFLLALGQYAREGVIFSTHSIGLARSVAEQIYSIQKQRDRTIVKPFEATPDYLEFIGELSFSTFKELGSDKILLVEGVNEVKAVQQLLRLVRKEHTTVILPLGGDQLACGGREVELSEFKRLSNNIFALVDSERKSAADAPLKHRSQFAETCRRAGINVCVTERRAIENYFSNRAVKLALGEPWNALGPFEELKTCARPWYKGENWKIARQMQLSELEGTDLYRFLDGL